jgi:hypothetical protein
MTPQLTLFEPKFSNQIRSAQIDGVMHFSALDIFEHYGSKGSAADPLKYWKRVQSRLEKQGASVSDEVRTGLVFFRFEGTKRPTPAITFKFFMRMANGKPFVIGWLNLHKSASRNQLIQS